MLHKRPITQLSLNTQQAQMIKLYVDKSDIKGKEYIGSRNPLLEQLIM